MINTVWSAFGNVPTDAQRERTGLFVEPDRVLVAVAGDRIVAGGAAATMELTVPGPATVPAAGITQVGVLPTHRRQGILTGLMDGLAADARRRGEPVAVLRASESTIYRRFGYGAAVSGIAVEIGRAHAALRRPVDIAGRARLLAADEAADALPPVHDRYRRGQPGEVSRTPGWWARRVQDPEGERGGGSARFAVVWGAPGEPADGYVTYRIHSSWEGGLPNYVLAVEDLVAVTPEARAGLWQYCFSVDLVALVRATDIALDDPLPWMLVDPRRLRMTATRDVLWVALLDVEAALGARTYGSDAALVLEVTGGRDAGAAGRYRIGGGTCRRTDATADLALDAADLAAAYLGGVRLTTLAQAGLVAELVPGALARADALFVTGPAPACGTGF